MLKSDSGWAGDLQTRGIRVHHPRIGKQYCQGKPGIRILLLSLAVVLATDLTIPIPVGPLRVAIFTFIFSESGFEPSPVLQAVSKSRENDKTAAAIRFKYFIFYPFTSFHFFHCMSLLIFCQAAFYLTFQQNMV